MKCPDPVVSIVFERIKQWKLLLFLFLFDFLFFLSMYSAAKIFDKIFFLYEAQMINTFWGYFAILVYFIVLVFAYSFFKYSMLDFLTVFYGKQKKWDYSRLRDFFVYNLIVLGLGLSVFLVVNLFFAVALVEVLKFPAVALFNVLLFLFISYFLQESHALFVTQKKVKQIPYLVARSFSWSKVGYWLFWNCLLIFTLGLVLFGLTQALVAIGPQAAYDTTMYTLFALLDTSIFVFLVVSLYVVILWNRLYIWVSQHLNRP